MYGGSDSKCRLGQFPTAGDNLNNRSRSQHRLSLARHVMLLCSNPNDGAECLDNPNNMRMEIA